MGKVFLSGHPLEPDTSKPLTRNVSLRDEEKRFVEPSYLILRLFTNIKLGYYMN